MNDETLAATTQQLLERIGRRISAVPMAEQAAATRRCILERAREIPLSTAHKFVWVSDMKLGGHMARTWACPADTEWDYWIANALDYMGQEFPSLRSPGTDLESEVRSILLQRLRAWRASESSGADAHGPPKRRKAPKAESHLPYRDADA